MRRIAMAVVVVLTVLKPALGQVPSQGRAFDFSATVNYRPVSRLTLSAGYRTIEGGADVDSVFAFAWPNAAVARLGGRF